MERANIPSVIVKKRSWNDTSVKGDANDER
jgi:hypothetical protein